MFCSHYHGYLAYNISDVCGLSQSAVTVKACCEYHLFGVAKPSNKQFRLTCSQNLTYHCLLDETITKEFEVCRKWIWIPEG